MLLNHQDNMGTLARKYRYKKYGIGGSVDSATETDAERAKRNAQIGEGAAAVGALADSMGPADQYGKKSAASNILGNAGKFASMGASFGGPWGAAAGAVIGAGVGLIANKKQKEIADRLRGQEMVNQIQQNQNMAAARVASDPSIVKGNLASGYYAAGGDLNGPGSAPMTTNQLATTFPTERRIVSRVPFSTSIDNNGFRMYADTYGDGRKDYTYINDKTGETQARAWRYDNANKPVIGTTGNMQTVKLAVGGNLTDRYLAAGGPMSNIANEDVTGGTSTPLSSTAAEFNGPSHEDGGIQVPNMGAEVEGKETTDGHYVFSDRLGFAKLHKPLAKAIGKIEMKAISPERINSLKLMREKENQLKLSQEYTKHMLGLN